MAQMEPRFLLWVHGGEDDLFPATAAEVSSLSGFGVVGRRRP